MPSDPRAGEGTPLYVHLPYCAAKCHYCDFFSLPAAGQDLPGVVDAILLEARRAAPPRPRTVFLGGGTPSLFGRADLRRLLDGLDDLTGFRASAVEVTAECNPESLDRAKASALLELGVTRLSIGVQSLRPGILEHFGRVHGPEDGPRAVRDARAAGCEHVSVDLIYGSPGQATSEWEDDLRRVLDLGPDHLSAYQLTVEPGTAFHRWRSEGTLVEAPEESQLEQFWSTRRLAAEHGLRAYEISNFASKGRECRHNVNYWRNGPYVGLGPSAVSKRGHTRSGNPRSVERWRAGLADGGDPREWEETPGPRSRLGETWWLGLRTAEGVDPAEARRVAGHTEGADPLEGVAREQVEGGWLLREGGRYRLGERGLPLADALAAAYLEPDEEPDEDPVGGPPSATDPRPTAETGGPAQ